MDYLPLVVSTIIVCGFFSVAGFAIGIYSAGTHDDRLQDAISAYADLDNWVAATGPMGDTLPGWCGPGKGWEIARGTKGFLQ